MQLEWMASILLPECTYRESLVRYDYTGVEFSFEATVALFASQSNYRSIHST
jgi:hypothetical protein